MRTLIFTLALLPGLASASTTIDVSSLSVDGLELRDIHCTLTQGGLFASIGVAGALAARKADFDACQPSGGSATASWVWRDGGTHDVNVSSATPASAAACVQRVLSQVQSGQSGSCTATIQLGSAPAEAPAPAPEAAPGDAKK